MLTRSLIAIAALAVHASCFAQAYPARPITFVVPAPPGGALDSLSRTLAEEMGKRLGQPIVIDNKPGAAGILAVQAVTRAAPDGYTVLVTHAAPIINTPYLLPKVPYDVRRDLAFVSQVAVGPVMLAVSRNVPARNMKEFLAWAAQNKGKVSYGSYGVGTFGHLVGVQLNKTRGLDMVHVAYKGEAQVAQDVLAGNIAWGVISLGTLKPQIESGRIRPLAVFGDRRAQAMPDVPTMAEAGLDDPAYRPAGWIGLLVRSGTPAAVLGRLEQEARAAAYSAPMKQRLQLSSSEPVGSTAAQFRQEFEKAEPVVRHLIETSGVKAE
ncbi:ABC transporter substrate-binding protein [Cupriavidus necator]|uniref:ABC transporter substrate-binding protein n=1 Tax=Cupriavidus necator TaxID=106590 RepID=A0A1U9UWE1_CUPNE|nr:tripartite tricarboxylate transporter substrate binding protein [Cupriavidus necator]AQV96727.1 ABC transporter substrate-binding protein [Cupriavidus necator]